MSKQYKYFGVYSPKSNYLNFIVSVAVPDNIDAYRIVRYLIYSRWNVCEITFGDMLQFDSHYYYNLDIGCHKLAVGSPHPLNPKLFFIKLACRYLYLLRPL